MTPSRSSAEPFISRTILDSAAVAGPRRVACGGRMPSQTPFACQDERRAAMAGGAEVRPGR
jgi:hypothetical protein